MSVRRASAAGPVPHPADFVGHLLPEGEGKAPGRRALTAVALEAPATQAPPATKAFSAFEWMVAFRYLRARNAQRSISVIAGFSFLGIVLGVAALIVVMSVMNGFRHDLMDKMIGLNGHMFLQGVETPLTDYDAVTRAGEQGSGRHPGAAAGRGPGVRQLPLWLVRRAGARHSRERSRAAARSRGAHHPGLARRLRCRPGRGGRLQARRTSESRGPATRSPSSRPMARRRRSASRRA